VDDVLGVELGGVGDGDAAEVDRAVRDGFLVYRPARGAAERTGDAAAHPQARPGRVDQRVGGLGGDIALDGVELHTDGPSAIG